MKDFVENLIDIFKKLEGEPSNDSCKKDQDTEKRSLFCIIFVVFH